MPSAIRLLALALSILIPGTAAHGAGVASIPHGVLARDTGATPPAHVVIARDTGATPPAHVVIARDTGAAWRATWHLAEPVQALRFTRPSAHFRGRVFEVVTPGFAIVRDGDHEVLRTSGAPVREVSVRFPAFDARFEKDYEFFRRFTDGSVAIYTGHLLAAPHRVAGHRSADAACDSCAVRAFTILAPPGAHVVAGGVVARDTARWTDATGSGTYVYVGAIAPVEAAGVVAIVDPGLPRWVDARWRTLLPQIFTRYRAALGEPPATRTTVLFDYRPGGASGHEYGGGVLPGVIQLGLRGQAWEVESHDALVRVTRFLAHEASHVWNAGLAEPSPGAAPWMHEGAADALAERMLLALGLIDEGELLATQTAALNDCRSGVRGRSMRAAGIRDARLIYACGSVLALLTESSLAVGNDLSSFWAMLIGGARADGGSYDEEDYRAVARRLGASDAAVASLARLADSSAHPDSILAALVRAGVTVVPSADPPPRYLMTAGFEALLALQQSDCGGRASMQRTAAGLIIGADLRCATFPAGATITHIGGHDVLATPERVWSHFAARCGTPQPVTVTVVQPSRHGQAAPVAAPAEVAVPCGAKVIDRPGYVEVRSR